MEEYTEDAFANRDEPIPVLSTSIGGSDSVGEDAQDSAKKGRFRQLKESFSDERSEKGENGSPGRLSLQDRMLSKLLQQVIPVEDMEDGGPDSTADRSSSKYIKRPAFSLPLMTNNFRRFNARIGIIFSFQNKVIRLVNWTHTTHTLAFLFVYSFICLDPYLFFTLPFATALFFIMVPAFMARHPPPPPSSTISSMTPYYSYHGPALAPAKTIKPASETSKDFFRNMRDLQNCMADFSTLHDAMVTLLSPLTNFSNETLSSTFFLLFTILTTLLFISAHLVPWRFVFLLGGNGIIASGHPKVQLLVEDLAQRAKDETGSDSDDSGSKFAFFGVSFPSSLSEAISLLTSASDISLDSSPEEREVEIFELQHRTLSPYSASSEWEPFIFTPTPYDPLSPSRIAGDRPRGCRFFEDVKPPSGWAWKGKKWELDLDCREWVVERMVTGVEFEVHGVSGDGLGEQVGGWVWDLRPADSSRTSTEGDDEGSIAGYGDLWEPDGKRKGKGKEKETKEVPRTWEEGTGGGHTTGEWRRRRWIRVVKRVSVSSDKSADVFKC
ncbi:hypothetical protein FQN54_007885 [Arachnomyces sp. PD_36]|nr:hypothetical protein FQN54_007885 [Arachnomyces sp. PD_36]